MEPKTIDSFKTVTGDVVDYWAMLNIEDVTDQVQAYFFGKDSAGVQLGSSTYVRVGKNRDGGTGTLVTRGEFSTFFDVYGDDLLTEDEWGVIWAANQPEEGEV